MSKAFPVIASILSPEALINQVLPGFGVGKVEQIETSSATIGFAARFLSFWRWRMVFTQAHSPA